MTEAVKKTGVKFGIILGAVSLLTTATIYSIDPLNFVSIWLGIGLFFVNLIIGIIGVAQAKKALNGFISFKEAFTVFFIIMALGNFIGILFMYFLFNFIDPSVKDGIMEKSIEVTVNWMQSAGAKTEDIKKTVEQMKSTDNFSLGNQLKSYAIGLIVYILIGLIVAAAFKKTPIHEQ